MSGLAKLDHLISLLDDDSQVVQEAIQKELLSMRQELPERLRLMDRPLTEEEEQRMGRLLEPARRAELEERWMRWRWLDHPTTQLEEGIAQISAYLHSWRTQPGELSQKLDALAEEAFRDQGRMDARELSDWLFSPVNGTARFRGNSKDYYTPHNSNLFWVLETGLGNPISLCCLYRLLGQRFGLDIYGCNFPGHFLAQVEHAERTWLVDCFNRGRFMLSTDVARHHPAANPSIEDVIRTAASTDAILLRILRNLDEAFDRIDNFTSRQVMRNLAVKLMED
ncbi:Transglutaminase-like superfamily protein [Prosthecobacter debontii]|uniref:Transglutaminase-like superfamily protein n=1 Tax=Prosthecobacter debontii TaxID=48467 RepID=A0A1T4XUV2_9BACT|nr:transglutaminase-like domain-containing protein [Prosthecobacter debontii]SKA92938.1 Transglutaminase-like superfamily protein [Prosthecobacter debontii]